MAEKARALSDLSPDHLRAFHLAAKTGSMTRAAELLFVTQSAVSHTVSRLEDRMGCRLFDRSGKGLALTEEGKVLFRTTSALERELRRGEAEMERLRRLEGGRVSFCVPILFLHYLLLAPLRKFHEACPGVEIRTTVENRMAALLSMVEKGEAEFTLLTTPEGAEIPAGLEALELGRFSYGFMACRSRFPELEGRAVSLPELARYPLILLSVGHVARTVIERAFEAEGIEAKAAFSCDTMALIEDFTLAGLGLGMSIEGCLRQLPKEKDVFHLKLRQPPGEGALLLIRRRGTPFSPAAERFVRSYLVPALRKAA